MNAEDQVCSISQARKLDMIGINNTGKVNPYFYWVDFGSGDGFELLNKRDLQNNEVHIHELRPAYTVAELGILLPIRFVEGTGQYWRCIDFFHVTIGWRDFWAKTESQARAEALIWLLEKKHIKAGDLKL